MKARAYRIEDKRYSQSAIGCNPYRQLVEWMLACFPQLVFSFCSWRNRSSDVIDALVLRYTDQINYLTLRSPSGGVKFKSICEEFPFHRGFTIQSTTGCS